MEQLNLDADNYIVFYIRYTNTIALNLSKFGVLSIINATNGNQSDSFIKQKQR